MHYFRHYNTWIRSITLVIVVCMGLNVPAYAVLVTTPQLASQKIVLSRNDLQQVLQREALQQQMITLGVDPLQAQQRLDSMTDDEIAHLSTEISELPAGGDALTVLAVVFVILLITDIAGYTDLFPFVKKNKNSSKKSSASTANSDSRQSRERSEPIVIEN